MSVSATEARLHARGSNWKWWVCGLLLLATMINYMDRLTLNQTAKRIKTELHLSNEDYGDIEWAFGAAFALGALCVGWTADRWNVRAIYPLALLGWSAAGFCTGFATTFLALGACRFMLGLFEAGNWPCALRTTQRILPPAERTLGNSILQSGAAIGAIFTPLIVQALVSGPGTWRYPFFVIGALGTVWVFLWLTVVRPEDLALPSRGNGYESSPAARHGQPRQSLLDIYRDPRFWVCFVVVIMINLTWHFFRVWLPLFLQESRGYEESAVNYFTAAYYVATDCGALAAGFATLFFARHGMAVHRSRVLVFLVFTSMTLLSLVAAVLPAGPVLLGLLLVIGFGALGLFPVYYSLSQEMTVEHQGKVTGTLGCATWLATASMHPLVGRWLDRTSNNYGAVVALAGLAPPIAFITLMLLWPRKLPEAGLKSGLSDCTIPHRDIK
jgi:ACS family hexuronate transporter-like MFS transporter